MRFSLRTLMLSMACLAACAAIFGVAVRNSEWTGIPKMIVFAAPLYGGAGGLGVGLLLSKPVAGFFCGAIIVPTVELAVLWILILIRSP
jgi:hypothetical protein